MQSGIIQSLRPSIMRSGSRPPSPLPQPLTPTRQQRPIRCSIIVKRPLPAGGAPGSRFYDWMSSAFTGQLLHQLHFIPAALRHRAALMMRMLAVSGKHPPCYSLLMQTAPQQINWSVAPSVNSCSVIDNVRAQVPSDHRCPAPAVTSPPPTLRRGLGRAETR